MLADVQALVAIREKYRYNIEGFVREILHFPDPQERSEGKDIYPWQLKTMKAYDRRQRLMARKSGHGVGKTTMEAWMLLHHILMEFPQRSAVTAPTEKQLFNALWADFKVWAARLPLEFQRCLEIKSDRCEFKPSPAESYISVNTARADQPEALQGIHSPGSVLLIGDEASGIPNAVFEAASGSMSGVRAMTFLAGNPIRGQGYFYECFGSMREIWDLDTVSCLDIPGQVAADFIKQITVSYGINSNQYRVRVLGEFPTRDDDTIIPFELCEAALERMPDIIVPKFSPVVWGVDPARFGSDRTALCKRQVRQLVEPLKWWRQLDTMEVAGRIKLEWNNTPDWLRPREINIDAIGIGAGVVDRLKQLGLPARDINVSENPAAINADQYANLRAELWFKARQWFEARDCGLPKCYENIRAQQDDLVGELTMVRYKFRPASGKIAVESKDDIIKRASGRSPDLATAFVLTFASEAIALAQGSYGTSRWGSKIARPLKSLRGV